MSDWTPAVSLNVMEATQAKFDEMRVAFQKWSDAQADLPGPIPNSGWNLLEPIHIEACLRRNIKNRKVSFAAVQRYAVAMANDDWRRTGQPIIFSTEGMLLDGQHRLWAAYLIRKVLPTYLIADVPHDPHLFAYIDNMTARTAADALYTAGVNGMSSTVATVIKQLAYRWDEQLLRIRGRVFAPALSNADVLAYAEENPSLTAAAHLVKNSYAAAVDRITSPVVAIFFAWKVCDLHGEETLDSFYRTLATATELPKGNAIHELQGVLDRHRRAQAAPKNASQRKDALTTNLLLAFMIKGFNAWVEQSSVKKLEMDIAEPFPQFVDPVQHAEAAE